MYAGIPVNLACSSNIFVFYKIKYDSTLLYRK
ncbi:hypothetical protein CRE_10691 [Caenorhabditis remanei]|uniref:Uncharacterized protein n=1 Tax=Caenorhabditis remanei TaxID=31234 RepID=E3NKS4_CAERE|nr:hypothetical protein CRE_10691 [Caenorhabditis remanei]